ncbi:helix-turn-helix transcriptional regulator [Nocardia higoensis]|uniref:Helix-turn-helix transcriptional regulator n=1 Tax=Nocardia higoensis TaxID=228599 RepID=A0ABS0D9N7_9NOCA|nr:TetR/AcrR family transcriptional regulator [Nocardia higoensis]MBF6354362.1 helix-turn-helix transcriptional regulator [Nocardia higoensis]
MPEGRARERADAARNRRAILDATRSLLAEHGAEGVTMDRVAAAAGVGKGTIFHRFGSRAGLLQELIAEPGLALKEAITSGPPPLGPGAPAADRLVAFFAAMTDMVVDNAELVAAYSAIPPHPDRAQFHRFWVDHIIGLLREARPDVDAETVAVLLFGMLGGEAMAGMVRAGKADRVRAGVRDLVLSVARSD